MNDKSPEVQMVGKLKRLELEDGDILLVESDHFVTEAAIQHTRATIRDVLERAGAARVHVLMVTPPFTVRQVLHKADRPALSSVLEELARVREELAASRKIRRYAAFALTGDENADLQVAVDVVGDAIEEWKKLIEELARTGSVQPDPERDRKFSDIYSRLCATIGKEKPDADGRKRKTA